MAMVVVVVIVIAMETTTVAAAAAAATATVIEVVVVVVLAAAAGRGEGDSDWSIDICAKLEKNETKQTKKSTIVICEGHFLSVLNSFRKQSLHWSNTYKNCDSFRLRSGLASIYKALFVWLVSKRPRQLLHLGYIAGGRKDSVCQFYVLPHMRHISLSLSLSLSL